MDRWQLRQRDLQPLLHAERRLVGLPEHGPAKGADGGPQSAPRRRDAARLRRQRAVRSQRRRTGDLARPRHPRRRRAGHGLGGFAAGGGLASGAVKSTVLVCPPWMLTVRSCVIVWPLATHSAFTV